MMRKSVKVLAGVFAAAVLLSSCGKDNELPVISGAKVSNTTAAPGEKVTISATLSDPEGELKTAELKYQYNGASAAVAETKEISGGSVSYTYDFTIPSGAVDGDTYTFMLEVVDGDSKEPGTAEKTFSAITVKVAAAAGAIDTFSAVLMGSTGSSYGSFASLTTGTVYTSATSTANSGDVDMIFYSAAGVDAIGSAMDTDFATTYFPTNIAGFSTKNDTKFLMTSITATDFDAISDDGGITAIPAGTITGTKVTGLATGKVVAFSTAGGKLGLMKVVSLNNGSAGDITVMVKVQQ